MGLPIPVGRIVLLCAAGASIAGYAAYRLLSPPPNAPLKLPVAVESSAVPGTAELAVASSPETPRSLVEISETRIDFGIVPTHYSLQQSVTLFNGGDVPLSIEGIRLEEPFSVTRDTLLLAPGTRTGLEATFSPKRPGTYEGRVMLRLGAPANEERELVVLGEAVLSPEDAGVQIPPPPDQAARRHQEEEINRMVAEARSALREGSGGAGDGAPAEERDGSVKASAAASSPGGGPSIPYPVVLAAFGQTSNPVEDPNQIPVPIPSDRTEPELPPAEGGDKEPAPEDNKGKQDDAPDPEAKKLKGFTIAPNSVVAVHSSQEPVQLQTFPVHYSPDGAVFQVEGRIRFPQLALAFGENVQLQQWGDLVGTIAPDGSMQIKIIVRIQDPGEAVLDLPITLTTGMAVGYSAGGRVMFANGMPRNSATGDFKVVGITNIPVGAGSALDKAPVYLELLGRLEG